MTVNEILSSNWFWALWGTMGAYAMVKIHRKGVPFFGDFATLWFGLTAFLIGFTVQFSFIDLLFNSSNNLNAKQIVYLIFLIVAFIGTLKFVFNTKWFKPFAFIIQMFILGMLANSIYQMVI